MHSYQSVLDKITKNYIEILGVHLIGLYVHGSIAFGCFHWEKSDIDLIAVVDIELSIDTKKALIDALPLLDLPEKGVEISFVKDSVCNPFLYPTPFLLHYSRLWEDSYQKDPMEYLNLMHGVDPDLAAHFTVLQTTGIVWYGKPVSEVFGPVSREDFLDSILRDLDNAEEGMESDPIYFILNLCRAIAYLHEGCILSKQQAGEWAVAHLSRSFTPLIKEALTCYCTSSDMYIDSGSCSLFCDYAFHQLSIS